MWPTLPAFDSHGDTPKVHITMHTLSQENPNQQNTTIQKEQERSKRLKDPQGKPVKIGVAVALGIIMVIVCVAFLVCCLKHQRAKKAQQQAWYSAVVCTESSWPFKAWDAVHGRTATTCIPLFKAV